MKILKYVFFSSKIPPFLFLIFACSMSIATFLEKIYSTDVAHVFIYNSLWFEVLMFCILLSLIGNIWKYKLWNFKKIPIFIFHISFIFIFIGGFFSRYYNSEGILSIREGFASRKIISQKSYVKLEIKHNNFKKNYNVPYILTQFHDRFEKKFLFQSHPIKIKIIKYIPYAKEFLSRIKPINQFIRIVSTNNSGERIELFIKSGEKKNINGVDCSFNHEIPFGINIFEKNNKLYIKSSFDGKCFNMINQKHFHILKKNVNSILELKKLYQIYNKNHSIIHLVLPEGIIKGEITYIEDKKKQDGNENTLSAITTLVSFKKQNRLITFLGGKNFVKMSTPLYIDNHQISIGYGSIELDLPFYLKLNKFYIKNYPGSNLPSFFRSYITLIDKNKKRNYSIYMNNILKYKGYRFFQSGYDPDQKGTHLFVNNDYLGTFFSYTGYIFMFFGMLFTLFWKGTRFSLLKKKLKKITYKKHIFFFIIFMMHNQLYSNNPHQLENNIDLNDLSDVIHIPKKHSEDFGKLLVQDYKGRIKPINTLAIDLLRKIYKKDSIGDIDANQWFISIHQDNIFWTKIPFIKVDKKGRNKLSEKIKMNKHYYVSMIDLYQIDPVTLKLKFILEEDYKKAFSKDPIQRNEYDKTIINLIERIGIIHEIFQGKYIRIFPIPYDKNHTWSSWIVLDSNHLNLDGFSMFNHYLQSLSDSYNAKNWKIADHEIDKIRTYQKKYAKYILPVDKKISLEIFYNKFNILYYLSFLYVIIGSIILILSFVNIFLDKKYLLNFSKFLVFILCIFFIFQSVSLIIRWYISGHAPWTNGYESSVFISWVTIIIGLFFYKNQFVTGISSIISSLLLMIAHGSSMDPEITNLIPVLKSNWLIIHVSTITMSYAFFFIGSYLGFLVLILCIVKKIFPLFYKKIQIYIEKLTIINEMCLTVGLFLLTIGTFLGSIWANNSWGRYWSWDPKETWALISIMIYAFVLHVRLIPYINKNILYFNSLSVFSISSIIMTYFGVNYYLSGLHSYAKGDPILISNWIYYILILLSIITILAFYFEKQEKNIKHHILK
ncbi:cytochrome c biogenesis protein [Blattabacterium cuenoti]|uniref:cytochrome c biogenesis protein n=1 Tax=Blattabacterium cuenoti TaxID=1653831 RepID=UPI00163D2CE2|nr:cytochrome c biogenesis protein CcsA [Blattabacterium cuenoti]